ITACLGEDAERIMADDNHLVLGVDVRLARGRVERSQKFLSGSVQIAAHAEHHTSAEVKARHRPVSFCAEGALQEVPGECAQIFLKSLFNGSAVLSSLTLHKKRLPTRVSGTNGIGQE